MASEFPESSSLPTLPNCPGNGTELRTADNRAAATELAARGWIVSYTDEGPLASAVSRAGIIVHCNVERSIVVVESAESIFRISDPPRTAAGLQTLLRVFKGFD